MIYVRIRNQEEYKQALEILDRLGITWGALDKKLGSWPLAMENHRHIRVKYGEWWRTDLIEEDEETIPLDNLETAIKLMLL
jgi:hypothetical protein